MVAMAWRNREGEEDRLDAVPHPMSHRRGWEASGDGFVFSDANGVIRLWSLGAQEIFGYGSREALGRPLALVIPERLRLRHWEESRAAMAGGATGCAKRLYSASVLRKDGTPMTIEFSMAVMLDRDGEMLGTAAIVRDVTFLRAGLRERLACLPARAARELMTHARQPG
jgi:PAS domain S-box-containing protein